MALLKRRKKILIVDADHDRSVEVGAAIKKAKLASTLARDGKGLLDRAREYQPHLILMEAELPSSSGFSVCNQLKKDEQLKSIPVIITCDEGLAQAVEQHRARETIADAYLIRPFPLSELVPTIFRLISPEEEGEKVIDEAEEMGQDRAEEREKPGPAPPPLPQKREQRVLSEDDKKFVALTFDSTGSKEAAQREGEPAVGIVTRRLKLMSAEERVQFLRERLKRKERDITRLAEIWEVREQEYRSFYDKLVEKEIGLQDYRQRQEEMEGELREVQQSLMEREREYQTTLDSLLEEKVLSEKELIEEVAQKEKTIHELRGKLAGLDRISKARESELTANILALEGENQRTVGQLMHCQRTLWQEAPRRRHERLRDEEALYDLERRLNLSLEVGERVTSQLRAQVRQVRGRAHELDRQLQETVARVNELIDTLAREKEQGEKLREAVSHREANLVELGQELARVRQEDQAEVERLNDELEGLRGELERFQHQLKIRDKALGKLKGILKEEQERAVAERERVAAEQERVAAEQERAAAERAGLKETIAEGEQRISGLEQDLAGREQRISGLEQDLAGREQRISGLEQDLAGREQQLAGIEQQLAELKLERERLQQKHEKTLQDHERTLQEEAELHRQVQENLRQEKDQVIEGLRHQLDQAEEQLAQTKEQADQLRGQQAQTQDQLAQAEGELAQTEDRVAQTKEELARTEDQLAQATRDREEAVAQLTQEKKDAIDRLRREQKTGEEEIRQEMEVTRKHYLKMLEEKEMEWGRESDSYRRELLEARGKLTVAEQEVSRLKSRLAAAETRPRPTRPAREPLAEIGEEETIDEGWLQSIDQELEKLRGN